MYFYRAIWNIIRMNLNWMGSLEHSPRTVVPFTRVIILWQRRSNWKTPKRVSDYENPWNLIIRQLYTYKEGNNRPSLLVKPHEGIEMSAFVKNKKIKRFITLDISYVPPSYMDATYSITLVRPYLRPYEHLLVRPLHCGQVLDLGPYPYP